MKSEEYERTVSELMESLVATVDGLSPNDVGCGRHNLIIGSSGYRHQIDVSFRVADELHLIECKRWKRRISAESVLTLIARIVDIQALNTSYRVRGALATTKGLQPGAAQLASHFGVATLIVKSPREFGLRYKNHIHLGVSDSIELKDSATFEVFPAPGVGSKMPKEPS